MTDNYKDIDDFFNRPRTLNQWKWSLINSFWHFAYTLYYFITRHKND